MKVTHIEGIYEIHEPDFMKWLADLEGDEFKQAVGSLRTPYGYCCLGVACTQFVDSSKLPSFNFPNGVIGAPLWLQQINRDFSQRSGGLPLSRINDTRTLTFKQIAKLLRKVYVEGVEIPKLLSEEETFSADPIISVLVKKNLLKFIGEYH